MIAVQPPVSKIHKTVILFDNSSGKRLHEWMEVNNKIFYDKKKIAILTISFYYPGNGKNKDLQPITEFVELWRKKLRLSYKYLT